MQPLGHLLIDVSFLTTLATALVAIYGAVLKHPGIVRAARHGITGNAFLYLAASVLLWHGLFSHDFANKYLATYSDREMPPIYLFTSFWGGEKGALLLWATVLTVFSAIAVHQARHKDPAYLGWAAGILMLAVFFYDILMVFESNPFERFLLTAAPKDGQGLNPLLQNPTMAIHPPSLLTGYIAFTLPFAFGAASLITGRLDDEWARDTRKWTLVSWLFLTTGLILGGAWAYQELGWGGVWMWDPVENAGLIPWFTASAFLHSIVVQERRGILRRWNFTLVCLTWFLTIFGTFLTRSQLIVSIHAFADSKLSDYFLWYMALIAVVSIGLLAWRWKALASTERIDSLLSREAFFVLNNVLLLFCGGVVLWGTLYPKLSDHAGFQSLFNGLAATLSSLGIPVDPITQAQDLGEKWFNKVMVPSALVLLLLTAVGPLIPWRRTTGRALRIQLVPPLLWSVVLHALGTALIVFLRVRERTALGDSTGEALNGWWHGLNLMHVYAWLGIWLANFTITGVALEFWRGGRVRQRAQGGGLWANVAHVTLRARRRYGGYIVHVGFSLAFIGLAGLAYKSETPETPLHPGDSVVTGGYRITFARMDDLYREGEGHIASRATLVVTRGKETVPVADVDRVAKALTERGLVPFKIETLPESPKILLRFVNPVHRDRLREEIALRGTVREHFTITSERPDTREIVLGFRDQQLLQTRPTIVMKYLDELRRTLGSLDSGAPIVDAIPGRAVVSLRWPTTADYDRARGLLREDGPAIAGLLLCRYDPSQDLVELMTEGTGRHLHPEMRAYIKHASPTTEVAIWSRPHEDLYLAMRPEIGKPFIQLLSVVNPLILLLWLGTAVMFAGGIFLLFPNELFAARARKLAREDGESDGTLPPRTLGATTLLPMLAFSVLVFGSSHAAADPYSDKLLDTLSCVCETGGERIYDTTRTLRQCDCPVGSGLQQRIRLHVEGSGLAFADRAQAILTTLVEEDPANERLLRFDTALHKTLMENTLCTCGCGQMALSECPLDCPWSPYWKRKFKILLAIGHSLDEIRVAYVAEANQAHREGKTQLKAADIVLNIEPASSWILPVSIASAGTALLVGFLVWRVRRRAAVSHDVDTSPDGLSDADRGRVRDELDDL